MNMAIVGHKVIELSSISNVRARDSGIIDLELCQIPVVCFQAHLQGSMSDYTSAPAEASAPITVVFLFSSSTLII